MTHAEAVSRTVNLVNNGLLGVDPNRTVRYDEHSNAISTWTRGDLTVTIAVEYGRALYQLGAEKAQPLCPDDQTPTAEDVEDATSNILTRLSRG